MASQEGKDILSPGVRAERCKGPLSPWILSHQSCTVPARSHSADHISDTGFPFSLENLLVIEFGPIPDLDVGFTLLSGRRLACRASVQQGDRS